MCEVKKGLLEKYDNSIMANGILHWSRTECVENISLTMTTASHKAYCSSRSEVNSPPLPNPQIENATLRIEKLLSAWSKHTLPLYPITFQLLCDTASSLTSFVTVLCGAVAAPIDAHSPFFNHAGWLDLRSHPPTILPKDGLLLSLLCDARSALALLPILTRCLLHSSSFDKSFFVAVRFVLKQFSGNPSLHLCLLRQFSLLLHDNSLHCDEILPFVAHFTRLYFPPSPANETLLVVSIHAELISLFADLIELGVINHKVPIDLSLQVAEESETVMQRVCELLVVCADIRGVSSMWEFHGVGFH